MSRRRKHSGHTPPHAIVAPGTAASRIVAIDALRGAAICAMIAYHFAFDLNWFGVFRADFNRDALWLSLRAIIVTAFLLLVGISLLLAHRARISRHRYWRRIALGEVHFDGTGQGRWLNGVLANTGGEVEIAGTAGLSADGAPRVNATVRPRSGIDRRRATAIALALGLIGRPSGDGGFMIVVP